jgi:hypothetical protein
MQCSLRRAGLFRITLVQRLYSMLRGEELDEDLEEKSGFEIAAALSTDLRSSRREEAHINPAGNQSLVTSSATKSLEVAYNPAIPIEAFDFIITDECHRSIYGLWRQVLEYFDAFLIGLTATPSKQTIGFFNQNLVTEYNHERAVSDKTDSRPLERKPTVALPNLLLGVALRRRRTRRWEMFGSPLHPTLIDIGNAASQRFLKMVRAAGFEPATPSV